MSNKSWINLNTFSTCINIQGNENDLFTMYKLINYNNNKAKEVQSICLDFNANKNKKNASTSNQNQLKRTKK